MARLFSLKDFPAVGGRTLLVLHQYCNGTKEHSGRKEIPSIGLFAGNVEAQLVLLISG
ncbi:MAG: hypothetical protein KKD01_15405 [Proteobacteria bacterium]|nr:hypothetical protein [Pseudomonadota bacterium]MBU1231688.1 hypothetical protein [Pseudomonadota bacterium]MBU1420547.1 hypothetical protein [Pseudomonadota bacterium]MBU1456110.1 hypothetical protein [Pseudomonadota bacterium]